MGEIADNKEIEFYAEVRWCDEDAVHALEHCGVETTDAAIEEVRDFCQSDTFIRSMITHGWDLMIDFIDYHRDKWEGGRHEA